MSVKCKRRLINIRGNCLTPGAGIFFYPIYKTANSPAPVGGRPEVKNEWVTQHISYLVSCDIRSILLKPATQLQGGNQTMLMLVVYLLDNMCIILHMCYPTLENLSKEGKVEFAPFWNKLNILNKISEIIRNANIHWILTYLQLRLGQNGS